MYVCVCYRVSDEVLKEHIAKGFTKEQLAEKLHCMTNCASCEGTIESMIEEYKDGNG
jgi:bacterioferritin-associated ferredoxin